MSSQLFGFLPPYHSLSKAFTDRKCAVIFFQHLRRHLHSFTTFAALSRVWFYGCACGHILLHTQVTAAMFLPLLFAATTKFIKIPERKVDRQRKTKWSHHKQGSFLNTLQIHLSSTISKALQGASANLEELGH